MISPILHLSNTLSNSATNFWGLGAGRGVGVSGTGPPVAMVMPGSGTLQNLFIGLSAAPGAGKSYAFTVVKNGSDTALTLTIADAETTNSDPINTVTYVAGDLLSIKSVPSGTPTAASLGGTIENDGSYQILLTGGANVSATAANYMSLQSSATAAATTSMSSIIPCAGVISNLYMSLATNPGGGKSYTATLVKNGTDTALTCTATGTQSADNTTNTVSVAAGDLVYWRIDPTGTPTVSRLKLGVQFAPTTDGESMQTSTSTNSLATSGNNFLSVNGGALSYNTNENQRSALLGTDYTLKSLYAAVDTAPGAGKSWAVTVRSNGDTTLTTSIVDANTSNSDLSNTPAASIPGLLGFNIVGTGTPTATPGQWSFVTYRDPGGVDHTLAPSDTVTLSDSTLKTVVISQADTISLSDTNTRAVVLVKTDSISLTDSMVPTVGLAESDTLTMSDATAKTIGKVLVDSITVTDAQSIRDTNTMTDTINLSDTHARVVTKPSNDTLSLSDAIAKAISKRQDDTITLTDLLSRVAQYNLPLSDTLDLTDSFSYIVPGVPQTLDITLEGDANTFELNGDSGSIVLKGDANSVTIENEVI